MVYGSAVASSPSALHSAPHDESDIGLDDDRPHGDRPLNAGRRRLIVAAAGVLTGGGLVARSITAQRTAAPTSSPTTSLGSTAPSSTISSTSLPLVQASGSQATYLIPRGGLFVWHGSRIEARALATPFMRELAQIEPVGPPTMVVVAIDGDDRSSAVVVFGRDVSGGDGGVGLWLVRDMVAPRLITRGARWAGGGGAAAGRFWVQGDDGFIRQYGLDSGRGGLPAELVGELVGSTTHGVVMEARSQLSWVVRREWTMVSEVIGSGRYLDSVADSVLWRTKNGKLRVNVFGGAMPSPAVIDSDSARIGRLSPFGPFAAVIDQDELIVWNVVSGEQKRLAQQRLVHLVWLSAQQLLLVSDDGSSEVFDLAASMSGAAVGSGAPKPTGSSVTVNSLPSDTTTIAWRAIPYFADYEPGAATT
jgi:hypothetical protein